MLLVWMALSPASAQDTGLADDDHDGYTVGEGDCDDTNPAVNPSKVEVCYDHLDNDCNGFSDELCDDEARLGSLSGGGACTGGSNVAGTASVFLVPLLWLGRSRRGSTRA